MNILSIDTSSHVLGVAVKTKDKKIVHNEMTGYQHEEMLFPLIIKCLKKADVDIDDIDKIAVSNGPGSYTGLRIGVACAIGLSAKKDISIVYVDTLEQLSYNVSGGYDYILPIIDAKANRVYTALFDKNYKRLTNDEIVDIDTFINVLKKYVCDKKLNLKVCIVGDGIDAYNEALKKIKDKNIVLSCKEHRYNDAYNLCLIGEKMSPSKNADINYMQKSQAERNYKG